MSPEEFYEAAKSLYDELDGSAGEHGHIRMDELMENCLRSIGYEQCVEILLSMKNVWYG